MNDNNEIISCGCCGRLIRHTEDENANYNIIPYPADRGFGTCFSCAVIKIDLPTGGII